MQIRFDVDYLMRKKFVKGGKIAVPAALLRVDSIFDKIDNAKLFHLIFSQYIADIKNNIKYNEVMSILYLQPVVKIQCEYKDKYHSLTSPLQNIYNLNETQIKELSDDLFVLLSHQWIKLFNEDKKRCNVS